MPVVYDYFQQYGAACLPVSDEVIVLEEREESLFYRFFDAFRDFSAIGLMNKTHSERPWLSVTPHDRGSVIPVETMKSFFKTQYCEN